jgi:hypothetical protein
MLTRNDSLRILPQEVVHPLGDGGEVEEDAGHFWPVTVDTPVGAHQEPRERVLPIARRLADQRSPLVPLLKPTTMQS